MQSTRIDGTDLTVSRLAYGTGSLHQVFRRRARQALLETAFDCGITHFDTSPYYGYGLAESDLGRFLRGKRSRVTLASKVGLYAPTLSAPSAAAVWVGKLAGRALPVMSRPLVDGTIRAAQKSLRATLGRCRTDYLDLLFIHEPRAELLDTDEFRRFFQDLQSEGIIRSWGLAGETETLRRWVHEGHSLARVVQTRDSVDGCEADFVLTAGRPLQFTYGYMSRMQSGSRSASVYAEAMARNASGSVILSTRSQERIRDAVEQVP